MKLYANPRDVVNHMLNVQEKVACGGIEGYAGDTVEHIDFAVPADIADRVSELKEQYAQLDSMHVLTIPVDARTAAEFVEEGMSNIGPDQFGHFLDELLGVLRRGRFTARSREWIPLVQGFQRVLSRSSRRSGQHHKQHGGYWDWAFYRDLLPRGGAFRCGRNQRAGFIRALARSRWGFADFLEGSIAEAKAAIDSLQLIAPKAIA